MSSLMQIAIACAVFAVQVHANEVANTNPSEAILTQSGEAYTVDAELFQDKGMPSGPIASNDKDQVLLIRGFSPIKGVISEQPILWERDSGAVTVLPYLKGYTDREPNDLNNSGEVIGYVSRPQRPHNQAFIWTPENGIKGLGQLPNHVASMAYANSEDRIVGVSMGNNEFVPVVWEATGENREWKISRLPIEAHSSSSYARAISPNGKYVAGDEAGRVILWTREGGEWKRTAIEPKKYGIAKAVNSDGMVVGHLSTNKDGWSTKRAFSWTKTNGLKEIDLVNEEDMGNTATAVNEEGAVVGHSYAKHSRQQKGFLWSEQYGLNRIQVEGNPYTQIFEIQSNVVIGQTTTELSEDNHLFLFKLE